MKKFVKILFIFSIAAFLSFSSVKYTYAVEGNSTENTTQTTGQITTTVSSTSSTENELLSPTNIVNILLIAVGIVLILLAVAIYIKLNR